MVRWVRGATALAVVAAIIVALRRGRPTPEMLGAAPHSTWPPFDHAPVLVGQAAPVVVAGPDWVEPADGTCPIEFPVKANDNSHIFHVLGGRFYDRTRPERCYATEDAAERDGYRCAKA